MFVTQVEAAKAEALWKMRDARVSDAKHDQTSEQEIVNRDAVRQELWNKHLRRVEAWEQAGSSTAGVSCRLSFF